MRHPLRRVSNMFSFFKRLTGKLGQQDSPADEPTDKPTPVEQRDDTLSPSPAQDQDNTGLQPTAPVPAPAHDSAPATSGATPAQLPEAIVDVREAAPIAPSSAATPAAPSVSEPSSPPVVGHVAVPASVPVPPEDHIVHIESAPAAPGPASFPMGSTAPSGILSSELADDKSANTSGNTPPKPSLLGRLWGGLAGEREVDHTENTAASETPAPASAAPIAWSAPSPDARGATSDASSAHSGFEIVPPPPMAPAARLSWIAKLKGGLSKTSYGLTGLFINVKVDDALFEELETALLVSDAGVEATEYLLTALKQKVRTERLTEGAQVKAALRTLLTELLQPLERSMVLGRAEPLVVMMTGVNGAGKTTSIGKLAKHLQNYGQSVLLAAGDTFRAAAREQLVIWGQRNNVTVVEQSGGDPAAVIFDAVNAARARKINVMMADTAGRLPTQLHLMEELKKVKRVVGKAMEGAPHEILLVIDANTGQNALAQVKAFDDAIGLTGLIVTKLDGTAKGGILAAIARQRPIPVYFIGVGESVDDLQPFSAAEFADALLG